MRKDYIINRLIQNITFQDRKEGYVKIYPNNTKEHELVKFLICDKLKRLGYNYVTIDLEGYRTGSLNEVIKR